MAVYQADRYRGLAVRVRSQGPEVHFETPRFAEQFFQHPSIQVSIS